MSDNETQLNIWIDNELLKRVKLACIEQDATLKGFVTAAIEIALDLDKVAMTRCAELGWTAPDQEDLEVIPGPSESQIQ